MDTGRVCRADRGTTRDAFDPAARNIYPVTGIRSFARLTAAGGLVILEPNRITGMVGPIPKLIERVRFLSPAPLNGCAAVCRQKPPDVASPARGTGPVLVNMLTE